MENHSKYRVVAKAVKHHGAAGEQVYRASYRILDHIGEEIEANTGTNDFQDITSAFNEAFALCHLLPGANIVNLSIVFGGRFRGAAGSVAAFLGLLLPPTLIVTTLGILYSHFGDLPGLQRTLTGIACAAVGLFLAVIIRMMGPLLTRKNPIEIGLMVAVFAAVGLGRLPLAVVLLIALPLSIIVTYFWRRRATA